LTNPTPFAPFNSEKDIEMEVYLGKSDFVLEEIYRKYNFQLSVVGLIIGAIFLILSSLGIFLGGNDTIKGNDFLQSFFDLLGNYIYWLFIIMLTLTVACGWLFGDLVLKRQKFNELIKTSSKATFVRNQKELEELAWKLGPKYWDMLIERKHNFKIRN
jgi:hypothetical protein